MPDITIIYNQKQQTFSCKNGTNLLLFLQQNRIPIQAPCAGNGTCGKCKVTMTISGKSSTVSACQTILEQDCIVELLSSSLIPDQEAGSGTQTSASSACDWNYGIAVDLGTTTVVSALVSLDTGQVLDVRREWNAQISYGSDVISRLKYIQDHSNGLSLLSDLIQRQILDMMDQQCKKAGISSTRIKNIVIAGNTIMQHIFAKVDPSPLAAAPYIPNTLFRDEDSFVFPIFENIDVHFFPCISAFIGGDITAGLLSSDLPEKEGTYLFLDIGTNGEMAIGGKDGFITCSTASGPAFEGAQIQCGMTGNPGAINHVNWIETQCKFQLQVIGNTIPVGICGSGLVDLTAVLLDIGILEKNGHLLSFSETKKRLSRLTFSRLKHSLGYRFLEDDKNGNGLFYLSHQPELYLSQEDIRNIQVAKAAIAAGIRVLLQRANKSLYEIDGLYIAGGFGKSLNTENAAKIGMIPYELTERITCIGNSSLAGAIRLLLHPNEFDNSKNITTQCAYIELADDPVFRNEFIQQMDFT